MNHPKTRRSQPARPVALAIVPASRLARGEATSPVRRSYAKGRSLPAGQARMRISALRIPLNGVRR